MNMQEREKGTYFNETTGEIEMETSAAADS
jgi:hypothetical protein